jgi:hypothetical protein
MGARNGNCRASGHGSDVDTPGDSAVPRHSIRSRLHSARRVTNPQAAQIVRRRDGGAEKNLLMGKNATRSFRDRDARRASRGRRNRNQRDDRGDQYDAAYDK